MNVFPYLLLLPVAEDVPQTQPVFFYDDHEKQTEPGTCIYSTLWSSA